MTKGCIELEALRREHRGRTPIAPDGPAQKRIPKLADDVADRIVALTLSEPPGETTHWTGQIMAKVAGVRLTSVQRIWLPPGTVRVACQKSRAPGI